MEILNTGSYGGFNPGTSTPFSLISADEVLKKREIYERILNLVDETNELKQSTINMIGLTSNTGREVNTELIYHTQQGPLYSPIKILSRTGGAAAGDTLTVVVDPESLDLIDGTYYHRTFVGSLLSKASQMSVQLRVVTVSDPDTVAGNMELVLQPDATTTAINVIAAGEVMAPTGVVYQTNAAFGATKSLVRTQTRYGVQFHQIQTDTPDAFGQDFYQHYEVSNAGGEPYLFGRYWAETLLRHELEKSRIMLNASGKSYNGIPTTMGIIPVIKNFGVEKSDGGPNWTITDLYDISNTLTGLDAGSDEVKVLHGDLYGQRLEQVVGGNGGFQNGAIIYDNGTGQYSSEQSAQKGLSLGVKSINLNNTRFVFCKTSDMTSLATTGSFFGAMNDNSELRHSAVFVPSATRNVGMDAKLSSEVPRMEVVYTAQPAIDSFSGNVRVQEVRRGPAHLGQMKYEVKLLERPSLRVMMPQKFVYYNGSPA